MKYGRKIYITAELYVTIIRTPKSLSLLLVSNLMPSSVFVDVDAVAVTMYELRDCPFGSYLTTRDPITPAALH